MGDFPFSRLRLFLSVDIVGSTAYKQSAEGFSQPVDGGEKRAQGWLEPISAFFAEFDGRFALEWDASLKIAGEDIRRQNIERPQLWKAAGDEVIYRLDLTGKLQALFAVNTFRHAIERHRQAIKEHSAKLDLKATAWLAGFPVNNAEIIVGGSIEDEPENPALEGWWERHFYRRFLYNENKITGGELDFIGPQMDLGFRLSANSTPRRMMLSADLVLLLIETLSRPSEDWPKRFDVTNRIFFDDTRSLKGVLSSLPYPMIWLDAQPENDLNFREDAIRGRVAPRLEVVRDYCLAFIEQTNKQHKWVMRPFIISENSDERYGEEPDEHKIAINYLRARWDEFYTAVQTNPEPSEAGTASEVDFSSFVEEVRKMLEARD